MFGISKVLAYANASLIHDPKPIKKFLIHHIVLPLEKGPAAGERPDSGRCPSQVPYSTPKVFTLS
jgi:hypothetical protein